MTDLKPCPFCGGEAIMKIQKHIPHGYEYTPTCKNTSCAGRLTKKWLTEAEAIEAWNGRADDHFRGATKMVERTAKVRPLVMGWEGVCTNCGAYTIHEMDYCHKCGARLEWE